MEELLQAAVELKEKIGYLFENKISLKEVKEPSSARKSKKLLSDIIAGVVKKKLGDIDNADEVETDIHKQIVTDKALKNYINRGRGKGENYDVLKPNLIKGAIREKLKATYK